MSERIKVLHLFKGADGAVAQNNVIKSEIIDLRDKRIVGNFALHQIHVGGVLTTTIEVCSTKDGTYTAPVTPVLILDAKIAGSYFEAFSPPAAAFMKIVFTETNVANCTSLIAWLNYQ